MAAYEQAKRLEQVDKDAVEKSAAQERRRTFWQLTVSGCIVAVVTVLGTYFVTKATEHEKGFTEGLAAAPASTVIVAAPANSFQVETGPAMSAAGVGGRVAPAAPASSAAHH